MSAHRVVDLPEPVGPVTSTRPLGRWQSWRISFERFISSAVMILLGIDPEDPAHPLAVAEEVAAEARDPGHLVGEVGVVAARELLAVPLGRDRKQDPLGVGGGEHRPSGERLHLAVVADHGRRPDRHVQVGSLHVEHRREELFHLPGRPRRRPASGCGRRQGRAARLRRRRPPPPRRRRRGAPPRSGRPGASRRSPWRPRTPATSIRHSALPAARACRDASVATPSTQLGHVVRRLGGALDLPLPRRGQDHDATAGDEADLLPSGARGLLDESFQGQRFSPPGSPARG